MPKSAYSATTFWILLVICVVGVAVFATLLFWSSRIKRRATQRFGEEALVTKLQSFDPTARRAVKGVLLVLALAFTCMAFLRPQLSQFGVYKFIPRTDVDVMIVMDYSKSMYAKDIAPSRIARAKAEVTKLIQDLRGARFGAVAFAGSPIAFPLTSDGGAVAQFFRQLDPNDMPVGGTATAIALEKAREKLLQDPKAKEHAKIIVLVTDGEDLEGNPVIVAKECGEPKDPRDKIRIDVVQIGGRAPEQIPDVGPDGKVVGWRRDPNGKPLTTELTAEGEAQLTQIATTTGGTIVRSANGETGIDAIGKGLKHTMREELAEKMDSEVWGDAYQVPLLIALVLFVVEAVINEAPVRVRIVRAAMAARNRFGRAPKEAPAATPRGGGKGKGKAEKREVARAGSA